MQGYDSQSNEITYQFKKSFDIAIQEDIVA
jgi:hypothetical protein